jgi:phosphoglycolate phosphatase-like HAD superfamily hydrolase
MTQAPAGFDLDMTLIDSSRAILGSFAAVAADTGVAIDPVGVLSRLGIKLEDELAYWFPPGEITRAAAVYRSHYTRLAGPLTTRLPGAARALAAVRESGARAVVITAKHQLTARLSLEGVGLSADELFAEVHGREKGLVLKTIGAAVYVGDTPADMGAAVTAGAHPVGVTTGSFSAADLRAAGAADVLPSLAGFPSLYRKIAAYR